MQNYYEDRLTVDKTSRRETARNTLSVTARTRPWPMRLTIAAETDPGYPALDTRARRRGTSPRLRRRGTTTGNAAYGFSS